MILNYDEVLDISGSDYQLHKDLEAKRFFKIEKGLYSDIENPDILGILFKKYPRSVITLDYALWSYELIQKEPGKVNLVTIKNETRIHDKRVKQTFTEEEYLMIGASALEIEGELVYIYDVERLLLETIKHRLKMDKDIYKEAINSFKLIKDKLNKNLIDDYLKYYRHKEVIVQILKGEHIYD